MERSNMLSATFVRTVKTPAATATGADQGLQGHPG